MQWPLVIAGLTLGAAALPHCALMCGAPCAAVTAQAGLKPWPHAGLFHVGRVLGYSAAGALAASSVAALGAWLQTSPALRPLWTLVHAAFLVLGLCWLLQGRQPAFLLKRSVHMVTVPLSWQRQKPASKAWRHGAMGLAWVAWPCAALQAALLLAALADGALGGALVMAAFALASMPGLVWAPWAWSRWQAWRGHTVSGGEVAALGFRVAGAGLLLVSGWALTKNLWASVGAWCGL